MPRNLLHAVPTPSPEPIDIGRLIRADILERDWSAVWIAADKAKAVVLADGPKRTWVR